MRLACSALYEDGAAPWPLTLPAARLVHPICSVILNDTAAYFCGRAFGKKFIPRPFLPSLSPNKTWEGFVGAGIVTVITAYFIADVFTSHSWVVCPTKELTFRFHPPPPCEMPAVFEKTVTVSIGSFEWETKLIRLHAVVLAGFASSVAPFGGFLASAIKRANKVKDFDSIIPGHGELT